MKVKDLLKSIEAYKKKYPDLENWEVYTEQLDRFDKSYKKTVQNWEYFIADFDSWEYFKCEGFNTLIPKEKIFTINVNY